MDREKIAAMEAHAAGLRCRLDGATPKAWQMAYTDYRNGYTDYGRYSLPPIIKEKPFIEKPFIEKPLFEKPIFKKPLDDFSGFRKEY
jgi:hypothetical protein